MSIFYAGISVPTCQKWWQDLHPRLCIGAAAPHLGQVRLERRAASSAPTRRIWRQNLGRDQQYLSYVRSSLWIGILRMSWPKVALMISLPVKSSLLKLPSIWEQSLISARVWTSCSGIANINYHVTAAVLIFTELNELEYITVSGGEDGMLATEIRNTTGKWQVLKSAPVMLKIDLWGQRSGLLVSHFPFDFCGHFKHCQSTLA